MPRILLVYNSLKVLFVSDRLSEISAEIHHLENKLNTKVFTSESAEDALLTARKELPQIIITDFDLPQMDGMELCHELRNIPDLKDCIIVFYTSKTEDYLQVAALNAGADDYIIKPVNLRVLEYRLKALLKRSSYQNPKHNATEIDLGDIKINRETFQISIGSKEIILPKKEFELLTFLATKPNKVFTRREIFSTIWKGEIEEGNRTIDVHIRKLRSKIGDKYIKTIKGVGYKLEI